MTQQTGSTGKWLIRGILTTTSPLHIGCGSTTIRDGILVNEKTGANIRINAVVTKAEDKPAYIPGSTIKGDLRSWLKEAGSDADMKMIEQIFGSDDPKSDNAVGGKAEFHDAFIRTLLKFDDGDTKRPPYWSEQRQTGVRASVTINRKTGTAREQRLFHEEFVPAGIAFDFAISGQDLTKQEIGFLLHALNSGCSVGADMPVAMGSGTGDGFGRFTWELSQVKELQYNGVTKWIVDGCNEAGTDIIATYGELHDYKDFGTSHFKSPNDLTVAVELKFGGSFLVNDPSRVIKLDDKSLKTAGNRPRLDHNAVPTLPSSSFRGALRSHAEKIIRTVGGKACRVDDLEMGCKAVLKKADEKKLCLACRMFGAPGWKTLVDIAPFKLVTADKPFFAQDFIAVDRFTGGVKKGAKFVAESLLNPYFIGSLKIDVRRMEPWQIGLLVLLLRDLEEGDVTFGFGSSKGYGACTATVSEINVSSLREVDNFQKPELAGKNHQEFFAACIHSFISICRPAATDKVEG